MIRKREERPPEPFFFVCMAIEWLCQRYGLASELRLLLVVLVDEVWTETPLGRRLRPACIEGLYARVCRGILPEAMVEEAALFLVSWLTTDWEEKRERTTQLQVRRYRKWPLLYAPVIDLTLRLVSRRRDYQSFGGWPDPFDRRGQMNVFVEEEAYILFLCNGHRDVDRDHVKTWETIHYGPHKPRHSVTAPCLLFNYNIDHKTYMSPPCVTHGPWGCCCFRFKPRPPVTLLVWT